MKLDTPEHLLAVLLLYPEAPIDIFCEGDEIPFMDGSALPFLSAVKSMLGGDAGNPGRQFGWRQYSCDLQWELFWDGGSMRVAPAPTFQVSYLLRREGIEQAAELDNPDHFQERIAPARSFLFLSEWENAESHAGGPRWNGADWNSGLLLAESPERYDRSREQGRPPAEVAGSYPMLNATEWRVPDELACHKILDLLGDLALLDLSLPRLRIEVVNGGHYQNHQLIARIQASVSAFC